MLNDQAREDILRLLHNTPEIEKSVVPDDTYQEKPCITAHIFSVLSRGQLTSLVHGINYDVPEYVEVAMLRKVNFIQVVFY